MAKTWVLQTETKGTGANVVPLERATKRPSAPEPVFVTRPPRAREPEPAPPRAPRRFRVVDVMTRETLVDDGTAAEAIDALRGVGSIVDVTAYVWQPEPGRWRRLTFSELRGMFDLAAAPVA
jgi:hypothetical protein